MKYKVGDIVRIKSKEYWSQFFNNPKVTYYIPPGTTVAFTDVMYEKVSGKTGVIVNKIEDGYVLDIPGISKGFAFYSDYMLDSLTDKMLGVLDEI